MSRPRGEKTSRINVMTPRTGLGLRVLFSRVLWIGWWIGLFAVTHKPRMGTPGWSVPGLDKLAHLVLYFVLAFLGGRYLRATGRRLRPAGLLGWAVVYALFAALDEWSQQFVQRDMSLTDWIADLVGIAAASLVLHRRWFSKRAPDMIESQTRTRTDA